MLTCSIIEYFLDRGEGVNYCTFSSPSSYLLSQINCCVSLLDKAIELCFNVNYKFTLYINCKISIYKCQYVSRKIYKVMNITELLNLAQNKSEENVNQTMLAKALGVTRQTINNRIRNNSEITISELMKFQDFLGIKIFNDDEDTILVDYYPDVFASCGNGALLFSEEKEAVSINRSFFKNIYPSRKYSMICAKGDSMYPFINDRDKLLVEHSENNQIMDNKIYVFCYKSEIYVKRLSRNLDEIIIKSDNPDYGTRIIEGEDIQDLDIIGQIVGIVRNI